MSTLLLPAQKKELKMVTPDRAITFIFHNATTRLINQIDVAGEVIRQATFSVSKP